MKKTGKVVNSLGSTCARGRRHFFFEGSAGNSKVPQFVVCLGSVGLPPLCLGCVCDIGTKAASRGVRVASGRGHGRLCVWFICVSQKRKKKEGTKQRDFYEYCRHGYGFC